jgi:cytochrome c oxidase assembly protein subunit 11
MDPAERRLANRGLIKGLLLMTAASFAFGWALVPLYGVFCKFTGIGNAEAATGKESAVEAPDPNRFVTIEFVADPNSVGSFDFHPAHGSIRIHPGKLYDAEFLAKNLSGGPSVAQAVPSISPRSAVPYFHKTECFCFSPQRFKLGESRALPVRFIVDPGLPRDIDKITLSYSIFDSTQQYAAQRP